MSSSCPVAQSAGPKKVNPKKLPFQWLGRMPTGIDQRVDQHLRL